MKLIILIISLFLLLSCNTKKQFVEKKDLSQTAKSEVVEDHHSLESLKKDSSASNQVLTDVNLDKTIIEEGKWYNEKGLLIFDGKKQIDLHIKDNSKEIDTVAVSYISTDTAHTQIKVSVDTSYVDNTSTTAKVKVSSSQTSFIIGMVFILLIILFIILYRNRIKSYFK